MPTIQETLDSLYEREDQIITELNWYDSDSDEAVNLSAELEDVRIKASVLAEELFADKD